ncbi:MAG: ADP-ribosylation factor-like protein [bacterium]
MAYISPETGKLQLTVVYDGPPRAGKTATMYSLSDELKRRVQTPVRGGRTLYFDWLIYDAGSFNGEPLEVLTLSVPGQTQLNERREFLLAMADSVIFVVDSTREHVQESRDYYLRSLEFLQNGGRPVPVLLQMNKRDIEDALPRMELDEMFVDDRPRPWIEESVASEGTGVRKAFIQAVSLAVAEVQRDLDNGADLSVGHSFRSAEELMERLREL